MKILIVEDNRNLRENLVFLLKKNNFLASWVFSAEEALEKIAWNGYDLIILDINLPKMSGKEFLGKIRKEQKNISVIILSSNSMLSDKIELFDLWADDYLTKPFEIEELLARIKSLLRRQENKHFENEKKVWDLTINFDSKKIFLNGKEIELTHKQYLIMELLLKNFWVPKTKNDILEYVWWDWQENLELSSTTLESHIYSLRKIFWKCFIKTRKWTWYIIE